MTQKLEGIISQLKKEEEQIITTIRECVKETNRSHSANKDKNSKRYVIIDRPKLTKNLELHVGAIIYQAASRFKLLIGKALTTLEYEILVFGLEKKLDGTIHVYASPIQINRETALTNNIDIAIKDSIEKKLLELGYKKMTIGPRDYYKKDLY